jgi:hypothetical protein
MQAPADNEVYVHACLVLVDVSLGTEVSMQLVLVRDLRHHACAGMKHILLIDYSGNR